MAFYFMTGVELRCRLHWRPVLKLGYFKQLNTIYYFFIPFVVEYPLWSLRDRVHKFYIRMLLLHTYVYLLVCMYIRLCISFSIRTLVIFTALLVPSNSNNAFLFK
jgi:hypothetical protein